MYMTWLKTNGKPEMCYARCYHRRKSHEFAMPGAKKLWKSKGFAMSGAIHLKQELRWVIVGVLS